MDVVSKACKSATILAYYCLSAHFKHISYNKTN